MMWVVERTAALWLVLVSCYYSFVNGREPLQVIHLLCLLPYHNQDSSLNPSYDGGQNIQPVLELARDQINNSSTLLENYTLNLVFAEDGCDILSVSAVSFVMETFSKRGNLTGILGPACSASTISLSSLTNRAELGMVMVHDAGSPVLKNRTNYPYLLGTLGSTDGFVQALLYLLERAQWKQVAVLYDNSRNYYLDTKRNLIAEIKLLNDTTEAKFSSPVSDTFIPLEAFEQSHLRVVFVLCPAALSRKILCLSFNRSLIYSAHQWVFVGHELRDQLHPVDFDFDGTEYSCTTSDMAIALEMSILVTYSLITADDSMLVSNITYDEYLRYYAQYREKYNRKDIRAMARNSTHTFWATNLYDTVWAWALVLDNLTRTQESFEVGAEYGNQQQSEMIVEQFYRTRFRGVSGEISFDRDSGYTDRAVNIDQVRSATACRIASIAGTTRDVKNGTEFVFIPDSFPSNIRESRILCALASFVAILQIFIVTVLHIFTVLYRKRPSIKASSPKLLHISYVGFYTVGLGIFIYFLYLGAHFPINLRHYFCHMLWGWCLPIGFMLSMGTVVIRTWRVYRIFKHYLNPGPFLSTPALIGKILMLLSPVLVVSITWNAIDPFQVEEIYGRTSNGMVRVKVVCGCTYYYIWLGLIQTYLISILLLLSVLSLLTCNIPNRSFDTTALRVLSYIFTLSFLMGFSLYYLLRAIAFDPNINTAVFAIHMNFMMAVYVACVFIPPFSPIIKSLGKKKRKISTTTAALIAHVATL